MNHIQLVKVIIQKKMTKGSTSTVNTHTQIVFGLNMKGICPLKCTYSGIHILGVCAAIDKQNDWFKYVDKVLNKILFKNYTTYISFSKEKKMSGK